MPKYTPTTEDEDLYGDVKPPAENVPRGTSEESPTEEGDETETTDEEIASTENSAVVSNKVLTGPDGSPPKEGDEIVLKVVKNFGDESEVAYAPAKPGESPMSTDSEIEAMDEKGMMY